MFKNYGTYTSTVKEMLVHSSYKQNKLSWLEYAFSALNHVNTFADHTK